MVDRACVTLDTSEVTASWLEIDLSRLEANVAAVRRLVGPAIRVCGVVKADAYGMGALPIARRLAAAGADMLAVYSPEQAAPLVGAVPSPILVPILVMMPVRRIDPDGALAPALRDGRLHLTLHDAAHLDDVEAIGADLGASVPLHLHIDTGMSRMGLNAERVRDVAEAVRATRHIDVAGIYTHFAAAEDDVAFTDSQMTRFEQALDDAANVLPDDLIVHAANTFAVHRNARYHRSMVRVGLGLYGYGPPLMEGPPRVTDAPTVRPIMRWVSALAHVECWPRGASVGYNRTHRLDQDTLLGVVPAGYGDGYALALSNQAVVRIGEGDARFEAPVLGRVNMDQVVVDLSAAKGPVRCGDPVELISNDPEAPNSVEALARMAGSSCYEVLCRLSRVPKKYVEGRGHCA